MKLVILKTNIATLNGVERISPIMDTNPNIMDWWVDLEDIDHVMRIEAEDKLNEDAFIQWINLNGVKCQELVY